VTYTTCTRRIVAWALLIASLITILYGATPTAAQTGTPPAPAATAAAPEAPAVQQLSVQVMPEYDDPRVLVIVQGRFVTSGTNALTFPAVVTFRLPAGADVNQMAAMDLTSGAPNLQEYTSAPDPAGNQWMLVTYTLDNPHFFYEYYYNPIQGTTDKQIAFTFNSLQPVQRLALEIQQPLKATNFSVTPPSDDVQQDDTWGFFYHLYDRGALAPDTDVTWQIRYTKTDPAPSLTREQVRSGPGGAPAAAGTTEMPSWALPLAGAIVLLIIAGVLALRARQPEPVRRPARRAPAHARTTAAPARPPQLSRSERAALRTATPSAAVAEDGERPAFCNRCGAPLQADAAFCHRCGKTVTAMTGGMPVAAGRPTAPAVVANVEIEDIDEEVEEEEERSGLQSMLARISPRLIIAAIAVVLAGALIWSATGGLGSPAPSVPAAPTAGTSIDQQQMIAGAEVFLADCATCHGARAEGGQGPALNSAGAAYLRSDTELRAIIANGRGAMPAFSGKLSAGEIDAVVYFIKRQWTPEQRLQQAGIAP
jgi:mono/diheme cytochrome c family protein